MPKKEVVLRIDEKDYNLINRNKGKIVELVRLSMYLLDMDEEQLSNTLDVTFLGVVDQIKDDYKFEEFGIPKGKRAKLRLIKAGLKKEGQ